MSNMLPVALYGLEVPPGDILIPASIEFPATIRITMAALDPTEPPEADADGNLPSVPRATLKLIKTRNDGNDDEDDDEEEDEYLQSLLANGDDDSEDDDEDDEEEEANGGPSDPSKSKQSRREAAIQKLLEATEEDDSDDDMEDADDDKVNGAKSKKGKAKASDDDEEDDDEDDSDIDDGFGLEEYVLCTLDTERNYQQPLDITVGEGEKAFFVVSGTHTIYLTGNYVIPEYDSDEEDSDEEDDDDYDLPPDLADLIDDEAEDISSDELDDVDGEPRVAEVDTDEEEAPKLVAETKKGKGKNKRQAEDDAEGLDEMISQEETKLSKKQQKKQKNNKGEAVPSEAKPESKAKDSPAGKGDKKVQFAKNLEQGPTGPAKEANKAATGVKVVQGVTLDDRKVGTGRTAKSGDKVGMRYIGKLENGKVFDSNKKGAPFSFKLGKGEVIKGWDIGVAGMAVGGERRLTIPAHLAYGSKSLPGIPANSKLIFDVKLLEIK